MTLRRETLVPVGYGQENTGAQCHPGDSGFFRHLQLATFILTREIHAATSVLLLSYPQCIFPENYPCGLERNVIQNGANGGGLSVCLHKSLVNKYQKGSLQTLIPEKPSK